MVRVQEWTANINSTPEEGRRAQRCRTFEEISSFEISKLYGAEQSNAKVQVQKSLAEMLQHMEHIFCTNNDFSLNKLLISAY